MKKIAVPLIDNRVSAHFGHSEEFLFFEIQDGTVQKEERKTPPPHQPGSFPKWVKEQGADAVLVCGIGQRAISLFQAQGIEVYAGAPAMDGREAVEKLLKGELELKPEECEHHHHH
jgi:predicted Fe-Mo cluster-binding NifX family protein